MTQPCVRKSGQLDTRLMQKILREGSHDLCEFDSGRLTPWIFKVQLSVNRFAVWLEMSAPLSGSLASAVASPHPRSRSVRDRVQSATTAAACPTPRTVHVRDKSANMSVT